MLTQSTRDYLLQISTSGATSSLHTFEKLLYRLDNPHTKLKCIHLAGTNGKGSVASFLTSILSQSGYKTGLYTSPDLTSVTERIRIGNALIPDAIFERLLMQVQKAHEVLLQTGYSPLTYFELLTAIAFLYYVEENCDLVVLETGLGGKSDATNIIPKPLCCVLTTISLDHTARLGHTLTEIATEKAGIIKPLTPVVGYPSSKEVQTVIEKTCQLQEAPLTFCHTQDVIPVSHGLGGQFFHYKVYQHLNITLLGQHQTYNAALSIEVIEVLRGLGLSIPNEALYKGLALTKWAGRLELINKSPYFLIDGAHNAEGALALKIALEDYFKGYSIIYLFGILQDKDYSKILELTMPLAKHVVLTMPPSKRATPPSLLKSQVSAFCPSLYEAKTLKEGIALSLELADEQSVIVAFGSLYFIGEIPALLKKHR